MFDSRDHFRTTSPVVNGTSGVMYSGLPPIQRAPVGAFPDTRSKRPVAAHAGIGDGVDAYGFPLGHFGKAPDLEDVENEYPFLHIYQRFWQDSGGLGMYRGGLGTDSAWIVHLARRFVFQSVGSHSKVPTSGGLFGGYPPAIRPGVQVMQTDLPGGVRGVVTGWR